MIDHLSSPAQLRTQYCSLLALFSVARILGMPEMDPVVLRSWYEDFAAALANFAGDLEVRERGQATVVRFKQIDLLSRAPDDSLLSILAHATPDRLSAEADTFLLRNAVEEALRWETPV